MKSKLIILCSLMSLWGMAQVTYWEKSVVRDYEEGLNLYEKQIFAAASDKFRNVMEAVEDPTAEVYVGAEFHRAMCAVYLFNKDAEHLVNQFVKNHPTSNKTREAIWNTSNFMFTRGKYRQAADWLQRLDRFELNEEEREAYHFKYGYSLLMKKKRREAQDQFYQIKDGSSNYAMSSRYYYAHIAYEDSNYVTALEHFESLLDNPSFGPVVPYYLAQIYYKTGDYDKLIATGEELAAKTESNRKAEIAKLVGKAYFSKKQYDKALEYFQMHRVAGGKMKQADFYTLGYCYYKTEQYEEALQSFNKITGARGETGQNAYYHLGDCYLKMGDKQSAMSAFKAAAEINNGNERMKEDAYFNYAKLNYELANPYEDAIQALNKFLKAYPNSVNKSDANKYLANLYITTKDYENALKAIAQSGLNTPEMREAYQKVSYFRGVEYYNALNAGKAIGYFDQSLKYQVNGTYIALAHYWKAEAYFKQKKYDEALKSYWSFMQTPGAAKLSEYQLAQYNKGYCFFMNEDYKNAAYSFRLFHDGETPSERLKNDAALRLGDSYFMQSNYAGALDYYADIAGSEKTDADYAQFQKALCEGLTGNNKTKISSLNKLLKVYPESNYQVETRYELGATSLKMDNNKAALSYFDEFLKYHPNAKMAARAHLNRGVIYRNMSNYDQSITTFKDVVAQYPATPEAREAISFAKLVYAKANRIDEYVQWVEGISFADVKRASLDSTVYTAAFDQYSMGNCPEAINGFESYLKKFGDGYFVLNAQNFIAECSYNAEDDVKAEAYYKLVIKHPTNAYTELALARLASINYAEEAYEEALEYYQKLTSIAEDVNHLRRAYIGTLRCANHLSDHDKVIQFADIIIADDKFEPEIRTESMLYKARSYWALEKVNAAWQAFTELKEASQGISKAEASYHIALIEHMNGKYEASNKTVFWMIDNLPSYAKWRFKALLVLAQNYYALDDAFQANYTLDFIIGENFNEEVVAEAKAMKEEIRREEEQKKLEQERREAEQNQLNLEIDEESDFELDEIPEIEEEEEEQPQDFNPQTK